MSYVIGSAPLSLSTLTDNWITTLYAGASTGALIANNLYFLPIFVGKGGTATRIGVDVSSATAGAARLGIYNVRHGRPSTLLLDAGTVDTGSTGVKEITISQALTDSTFYCLALVANATPSLFQCTSLLWGANFSGGSYGVGLRVRRAFTYGALPADETGQSLNYDGGNSTPIIWVRTA